MKASDFYRIDSLIVRFFSEVDLLSSGDSAFEKILEIVEQNTGELLPNKVRAESQREVRYSRAAAKKQFARRGTPIGSYRVSLFKEDKPGLWAWLSLEFILDGPVRFAFDLRILPLDFYRDELLAQERIRCLLSFVRGMAHHFPPAYAYAHSKVDESMGSDPHHLKPDAPMQIHEMYWLNVYGKEMVDTLGRERVLSTPATHLEELPHGGVLFLTRAIPGDFASDEARIAQARALVHLKPGLSFDSVLADLRRRSAYITPVEKNWDPDLVELLDLTLDSGALKDRQRETIRLNAWRPPPVSEWMPLAEAPPCDAEDGGRAMLSYIDVHAESPVAMFHDDVPEAIRAAPDSLAPLDHMFWIEDFPNCKSPEVLEKRLIPAVGAYLGRMMVQHLGGQWVVRRKLDECYVALGDRAWLPFLRARHYFQSKQSVLDYSMTKFFREAERHARAGSHPG